TTDPVHSTSRVCVDERVCGSCPIHRSPYILPLHGALPIWIAGVATIPAIIATRKRAEVQPPKPTAAIEGPGQSPDSPQPIPAVRSEEHTSELQSRENLVCRLLLEKKKISKNKQN